MLVLRYVKRGRKGLDTGMYARGMKDVLAKAHRDVRPPVSSVVPFW
jgi:hypothetical protein